MKRKTKARRVEAKRGPRNGKECLHIMAVFDRVRGGHRASVRGCYRIFDGGAVDPHFGYGDDLILSATCDVCGKLLGIGPANDANLHVQREIDAAGVIAERLLAPWLTMPYATTMTHAEDAGYCANESLPHFDSPGWHIGYLVRCAVDDDGQGWPWDATRPVGPQYPDAADEAVAAMTDGQRADLAKLARGETTGGTVIPVDAFDDEAFDTSNVPDEVAR